MHYQINHINLISMQEYF